MIYAQQTGNWQLHLHASYDIFEWTFAYDRYKYARYSTLYLANMFSLENDHPDVYKEFSKGHFSVQMSNNNTF